MEKMEKTVRDYTIPAVRIAYLSIQNEEKWINESLKACHLQAVLVGQVVSCNNHSVHLLLSTQNIVPQERQTERRRYSDSEDSLLVTRLTVDYRGHRLNLVSYCVLIVPATTTTVTNIRFTTDSQIVLLQPGQDHINSNLLQKDVRLETAFGQIRLPFYWTMIDNNLNEEEKMMTLDNLLGDVKELVGLVAHFAETSFKRHYDIHTVTPTAILLEDLSSSQETSLEVIACLAKKASLPLVIIDSYRLVKYPGYLFHAYGVAMAQGDKGCILFLRNLSSAFGDLSPAALDFDDKLKLNLQLQKLMQQGSQNVLIVASCPSLPNPLLLPAVQTAFSHTFTLQLKKKMNVHMSTGEHNSNDSCYRYKQDSLGRHALDRLYGVEDIVDQCDQIFLWPSIHADLFQAFNLTNGYHTGLLLVGPSGCGKSVLPYHLARRYDCPILQLHPFDVIKSEIGGSEKAVQRIFQDAQRQAPSILFIDELPAIFSSRSMGLTSTFLGCLDDIREWNKHAGQEASVLVIASCRDIDEVPSACCLPGRLGKKIVLGPMTTSARREFFTALMTSLLEDLSKSDNLSPERSDLVIRHKDAIELWTTRTEGCTPGQINQLIRRSERSFRLAYARHGEDRDLELLTNIYVELVNQIMEQSLQLF